MHSPLLSPLPSPLAPNRISCRRRSTWKKCHIFVGYSIRQEFLLNREEKKEDRKRRKEEEDDRKQDKKRKGGALCCNVLMTFKDIALWQVTALMPVMPPRVGARHQQEPSSPFIAYLLSLLSSSWCELPTFDPLLFYSQPTLRERKVGKTVHLNFRCTYLTIYIFTCILKVLYISQTYTLKYIYAFTCIYNTVLT